MSDNVCRFVAYAIVGAFAWSAGWIVGYYFEEIVLFVGDIFSRRKSE